jgi:hypothetical protein
MDDDDEEPERPVGMTKTGQLVGTPFFYASTAFQEAKKAEVSSPPGSRGWPPFSALESFHRAVSVPTLPADLPADLSTCLPYDVSLCPGYISSDATRSKV